MNTIKINFQYLNKQQKLWFLTKRKSTLYKLDTKIINLLSISCYKIFNLINVSFIK